MDANEVVVEELTLLLLYLTSWTENGLGTTARRAWKGYPFETLDALEAKGCLTQTRRAKSACLTEAGAARAEELKRKYLG